MTQLNRKKYFIATIAFVLFLLVIIVGGVRYFQHRVELLQTQAYKQDVLKIKQQLKVLIADKEKATMGISLSLAENPELKSFFDKKYYKKSQERLQKLSQKFKKFTAYRNVWVQLIDAKGVSVVRSWSDVHGDSLCAVRKELEELLENPHPVSLISVGKYTISFRSMVPVYKKDGKFLGFVETLTHFNSITKELEKNHYDSILLVDKRYKKQLTHNVSHRFINSYYVANFTSKNSTLKLLENIGIKKSSDIGHFIIDKHYFVTNYIIKDRKQQPMAYYILIKDIGNFDYKERNQFIISVEYLFVGVLLLFLSGFFFFYFYSKNLHQRERYFHSIVDTSSELITITNGTQALDANKAFFDFFKEYKDLEEFQKKMHCICDMFVKEKGYISATVDKISWYEYILAHPNDEHKVKIFHEEREYIFTLHLRELVETKQKTYTLALTDITGMELYKDKLEHISQTDTLTNIGNRYKFNETLAREFTRAQRYNNPLSLVMLDIDHFKNINDTYGHDVGDSALIALTKEVTFLLRHTDVFCRYGGEEFMIIMPESTQTEAKISAHRIRQHIEELRVYGIDGMTISLGVTEKKKTDTIEAMIKRVDEALYFSKENGRNRVTVL